MHILKKNQSIIVGCIPNSSGFDHPADRRRYLMYLLHKKIPFEIAQFEKRYDVLYVSISADLGWWSKYKAHHTSPSFSPRVVFDLSDSYLSAGSAMNFLRPLFYFFSGRTKNLSFSHKETLFKMIRSADVIACGSVEQKSVLDQYHHNVIITRDYFESDIRQIKTSHELAQLHEIHVLWEGLSHGNEIIFKELRDILSTIEGFRIHLHVVTDPAYCRFGARHFCDTTVSVLQRVFRHSSISCHFYEWNRVTFSAIAASCDFAVIPIPNDPVMRAKPENKLLLLWSVGLPVITTATLSYKRVMTAVGSEALSCTTRKDWTNAINIVLSSSAWRAGHMDSVTEYLTTNCSKSVLLSSWEEVFGD
jgi:hypothetical protein